VISNFFLNALIFFIQYMG